MAHKSQKSKGTFHLHDKGGFFFVLLEHIVPGLRKRSDVLLGYLFVIDPAGWNFSVEIVVVEAEVSDVGKVHEGGRDLPSEVVFVKLELGEGGKYSELSRERAFEAIHVKVKIPEGGESAKLRG